MDESGAAELRQDQNRRQTKLHRIISSWLGGYHGGGRKAGRNRVLGILPKKPSFQKITPCKSSTCKSVLGKLPKKQTTRGVNVMPE
jgi:hypothetical protein